MSFRTRTRRWLVSLLSLVLLLTQFAVTAYACPGWEGDFDKGTPHRQVMADMPGCHGMGMDMDADDANADAGNEAKQQPLLCKAHCDRDKQSTSAQPSVDLPSLGQILSFVVGRIDYAAASQAAITPAGFSRDGGPPRGSPPVYLTLQVLRN